MELRRALKICDSRQLSFDPKRVLNEGRDPFQQLTVENNVTAHFDTGTKPAVQMTSAKKMLDFESIARATPTEEAARPHYHCHFTDKLAETILQID